MADVAFHPQSEKAAFRSRLRAARAVRGSENAAQAGEAIARVGADFLRDATSIAAYAGIRGEPPTRPLLDRLVELAITVLLPVVDEDRLDWTEYDAWPALVDHDGLLEPVGSRRGPEVLRGVDVVLAPALAVDRHGHRLGRGGGHYDRALVGVPRKRIVAVVFSDEILDDLPVEPHDVMVGAALTPDGVVELGGDAGLP